MFGFTEKDFVDVWLKDAEEGRAIIINNPRAREMIQKEIDRVRKFSEDRVAKLEALLKNK